LHPLSFTAGGRRLLGVFGNGDWILWGASTGQRVASPDVAVPAGTRRTVVGATATSDGRVVAVGTNEGEVVLHGVVRVDDARTGSQTAAPTGWMSR
jgi:hypothetical protein